MKKWILAITIVSVLSLVGLGVAMAQDRTPESPDFPGCPNCPFEASGDDVRQVLHSYMVSAMANALGISIEDFESYRESGLTIFEIAEELNLDIDALSEAVSQVRQDAIDMAFADGVLTQDQYEFMIERADFGHHFGGGMGDGYRSGRGFGKQHSGYFGGGNRSGGFGAHHCP